AAGSRSSRSTCSCTSSPSRITAWTGASGQPKSRLMSPTGPPSSSRGDEVVQRHRTEQAYFDVVPPVPAQLLDRLLELARTVGLHEERDVGGVPLMRRLPDVRRGGAPGEPVDQRLGVGLPPRGDGVCDHFTEPNPLGAGRVLGELADAVTQLPGLGV